MSNESSARPRSAPKHERKRHLSSGATAPRPVVLGTGWVVVRRLLLPSHT
jgi:hypothetical protein